jgi:hypothetical protein
MIFMRSKKCIAISLTTDCATTTLTPVSAISCTHFSMASSSDFE